MSFSFLATSLGWLLGQSVISGYCSGGKLMPAIPSSVKSRLAWNGSVLLPNDQFAILCSISKKNSLSTPWPCWSCGPAARILCFLELNSLQPSVFVSGFPGGSDGKESICNAGDLGLIPGLGRSPGGGHGNHSSILACRIPMDRGVWWASVYRVTKSRTQLSDGLCIINLPNWTPYPCFLYLLW